MNEIPAPDSTGGLESSEPAERALARAIVADAVDRYLEATRARIAPFVNDHFSFAGAWALHRRALGRDLLRAPVNVMLVLPQVVLLPAAAALARRAGWRRAAEWLGSRQLLRETDVAREIAWLVHTELLRLPYRQGRRESARDALAEEVFGDPRTEAADRSVLEELARRTSDAAFRRDLEDKLAAYRLSRSAVGGAVHGDRQRGDRRRGVQATDVRGDDGDPGRFAVRDHWIARLLDAVDLLRTAWSKLH